MIIEVRYDNVVKTFDIPKEEFDLMVETDYQMRLADARTDEDKSKVKHRTPQEIMKELNDKEKSSFRKYNDHLAFFPKVKNSSDNQGFCTEGNEEGSTRFSIDLIEDPNPEIFDSEYEDICNFIRSVLKPMQAKLIIDVVLDGIPVAEIAKKEGVTSQAISGRLNTAKKNLKKFLKNPYI